MKNNESNIRGGPSKGVIPTERKPKKSSKRKHNKHSRKNLMENLPPRLRNLLEEKKESWGQEECKHKAQNVHNASEGYFQIAFTSLSIILHLSNNSLFKMDIKHHTHIFVQRLNQLSICPTTSHLDCNETYVQDEEVPVVQANNNYVDDRIIQLHCAILVSLAENCETDDTYPFLERQNGMIRSSLQIYSFHDIYQLVKHMILSFNSSSGNNPTQYTFQNNDNDIDEKNNSMERSGFKIGLILARYLIHSKQMHDSDRNNIIQW
eukprot:CAMPEP_0184858858 /NCGR_PEP_ID=MMETSP0580-20130426/3889_1 /TAXON_ID=1118495 /ORGANISM="Dactyliosolen fragilissimus" /LENGTH=263 /DNA_ID=CAMNT_0027355189 /DNA_START=151 /DNA_END=939 /DNA_ORIENTATION=+